MTKFEEIKSNIIFILRYYKFPTVSVIAVWPDLGREWVGIPGCSLRNAPELLRHVGIHEGLRIYTRENIDIK